MDCILGYQVRTLEEVAAQAQIIVTTTGCKSIVRGEHMVQLPDDAIICNVSIRIKIVDAAFECFY